MLVFVWGCESSVLILVMLCPESIQHLPDSKVHGANMGSIWGRQDPGGPHVGPINFAIWALSQIRNNPRMSTNEEPINCTSSYCSQYGSTSEDLIYPNYEMCETHVAQFHRMTSVSYRFDAFHLKWYLIEIDSCGLGIWVFVYLRQGNVLSCN